MIQLLRLLFLKQKNNCIEFKSEQSAKFHITRGIQ